MARKPMTDEEKAARAAKMRAAKEAKKAEEAAAQKSAEEIAANVDRLNEEKMKDAYEVEVSDIFGVKKDDKDVKIVPLTDLDESLKGETATISADAVLAEADVKKKSDAELDALREQNASLMAQMRALQEQINQLGRPQIYQVSTDSDKVHFLWQAEVSDDNVQLFGEQGMYGRIVGKSGSFYIPKNDLSRILDERTRWLIDNRWLIVIDGLTDEEREALNCNYKEGELLDKRAFAKMTEIGDEILAIYPRLCAGHREMVARRFAEAYDKGSPYVTRERVVALNNLSKRLGSERGDFIGIIEAMNAADAR